MAKPKYWNIRICSLEECEDVLNEIQFTDALTILDTFPLHTTGMNVQLMAIIYIDPTQAPAVPTGLELYREAAESMKGENGWEVLKDLDPKKIKPV